MEEKQAAGAHNMDGGSAMHRAARTNLDLATSKGHETNEAQAPEKSAETAWSCRPSSHRYVSTSIVFAWVAATAGGVCVCVCVCAQRTDGRRDQRRFPSDANAEL